MALAAGATLGAYRIVEPLGRGGMASVYKAYEASLERHVALKVLPGEFLHEEAFAERFRREARVAARLEHPNIVPIFAFGIEQGAPWMAMRLIAGGTLAGLLRQQRLAGPQVAAILRGVAQALDYAHAKGVVHRDVKPQNVLLDEAQRVYLADFGIARMLEGSSALTQTGMISGTPQYMAPEQAVAKTVDHRADVYALGIVAYEMLTGHVPFSADTPVAVLIKQVQEPMPLPAANEFPEPLVRALMKATAKDPGDRWPSAGAFVEALEAGLSEAGMGQSFGAVPGPGDEPALLSPLTDERPAVRPTLAAAKPAALPPAQWFMPFAIALGAITMLMLGGAVAYVVAWRSASEVAATAAMVPRAAPAAPAGQAATRSAEAGGGAALPAGAEPARADADAAAGTGSAAARPPAAPPARLAIDFEHGLKSGTLRAWVDEQQVVGEALDSRVTSRLLVLSKRKGRLEKDLDVSPGSHTVRVEVAWDDNRKTRSIVGSFKAGVTRRLEVRVGGLRKSLSLDWK